LIFARGHISRLKTLHYQEKQRIFVFWHLLLLSKGELLQKSLKHIQTHTYLSRHFEILRHNKGKIGHEI